MSEIYPPASFFLENIKLNYPEFDYDLNYYPDYLKPFINEEIFTTMKEASFIHDFMYRNNIPDNFEYNGETINKTKSYADNLFLFHLKESQIPLKIYNISNSSLLRYGEKYYNTEKIESKIYITYEILKESYLNMSKANKNNNTVLIIVLILGFIFLAYYIIFPLITSVIIIPIILVVSNKR